MDNEFFTIKIAGDGVDIDWVVSQEVACRAINVIMTVAQERCESLLSSQPESTEHEKDR